MNRARNRDTYPLFPGQPEHALRDGVDVPARGDAHDVPFPTGWYRLVDSDALPAGGLHDVHALGRHIVVGRDDRDACWAISLGSGSGAPTDDEHITPTCSMPVVERHGMVFAFHHESGTSVAPTYELPEVRAITRTGMTRRGRFSAGTVRTHISDFRRQRVDIGPMNHVIGSQEVSHAWVDDAFDEHVSTIDITSIGASNGSGGAPHCRTTLTMVGPGGLAWFHIRVRDMGEIVLFHTQQPTASHEQQVMFHWFAEPSVSNLAAWSIVGQWVASWKADLRQAGSDARQPGPGRKAVRPTTGVVANGSATSGPVGATGVLTDVHRR